ncbi:MAG: pantetheine-phosphate adenylyltransferase, partial [Candidatus Omnitrophica bacterium]|nr:pantetheine-phosphate adenylyltransferase [Candidatus Omnitrophota bacterium]
RIPHADMGVFVAKLDELLEEGIAGLAPAGKKSRIALISEVQNTIWRFNNRRLKEKYVKAMLGEISGLHKFIFVFGDTVYILDFQRAFSGKLETHRIFTSCRKGYKECDLRLGETILEFKFTLHFNDLYRQIVGLNKSISVFSLIQDARQAKNDLVPADAAVLGSIKNIVAFGEHAPANLISGIETYVRGHSRSADHRNSQPLRMRREFTEDGYTVRLTLEEFEDLLSSPPMLEGSINELEEFRRFQKKRRSYNDTPAVSAGDVLNVIRPIFADLKNAVPLERFDVYISISNPGVVIPASRDGGKHVNSKTRFVLPSIILESPLKSPRGLRIGVYPAYYRGLDETDLDILFNGKKVFDRIFIVAAGEAWDTDNSALQNRLNRIYLSVKHIPGVFAVGMAGRCFLPEAARKFGAQAVMRRLSRAPPVGGASSEVDMETDALYYKNYGLDTVYLFHTEETRSKPASRRSFFPLTLDGLINALAAAEKTANNAAPIIGSLMLGADTVLFPGSFDILTNGHIEIISRLGRIFNKVYVGVGNNPDKEYIFAANERVRLIQEAVKQKKLKNVKVYSYGGLTVDFAQSKGIMVMARGLRDNQDLIDEVRLASNNAKLNPDIQTIFLAGFEYPKVSSSKVKELAGDDSALSRLVPDNVKKEVQRKSRINDRGRCDGGNDIHDPADYGLGYEVGSVHLVDKRNNYIIGEAVVDWKNTEMTIRRLFVYNRGEGFGTIFYSKLEADAIKDGFTDMFVEPRKNEATGLPYEKVAKFWEKMGFDGYFIMHKNIGSKAAPKDGGMERLIELDNSRAAELAQMLRQEKMLKTQVDGDIFVFEYLYQRADCFRYRIAVSYFKSMGGFIDSKLIKVKDTVIAVSHTAFQPSPWKSTWKEEILLDSSKESWVVDDSAMYGFKGVGRTILALAMRISYMENAEWFYIREPNDEILGLLDKLGFEPVESPETLGMLSEEMVYGFRLGQEVYPSIKISRLPVRSGWGLDTPFSSDGGRDRIREYASGNPSQQQIIAELESLVNARNDDPDPLKHILYVEQGLLRLLYSSGLFTGRTIINIPAGLDILPAEFAPTYNLTYYAGAKLNMARDMAEDYLSGFGRYRDNLIYRDCDVRYINTYKHLGISGKKLLLSKGLSSFVQPFNRSDYIAGLDKEFLLSGDRILIMDQEDRLCFEGLFLDEGFYPVGDLFSGDIQERLDNLLRKINDSEITAWPYAGRNSLLIPTALVVLEKPAFKDGGVKRIYLLVHPLYSYELMLESEITEIFNGWKSFLELAGNDPDSIVVYIQENNECLYNQPLSECVDDLVNNLRKRVFYNSFPCDFELNMDKERELSIYACGDIFEGCLVELTEKLAWKLGLPKITAYLVYDMSIGYLGNAFPGIIRHEKRLSAEMKARDYGLRIISYSDLAKEIGRVTEKGPAGDQGKDGGKLYKVYSALPFLFLALLPNAASAFVYFVFEDVFGPLALFPVLAVFLTLSLVYPFVILAISSVVAVIFGIGHSKLPGIFPGP